MTIVTTVNESELSQLGRIYNSMLTSAEINIRNRPYIRSFDNRDRRVSLLAIPTLEDLKYTLFEPSDLVQDVGYPLKVTTKQDIESAAFLALSPPGTLGHYSMIPTIVSRITEVLTEHIHSFTEECVSHGGTTKIVDAEGLTELSPEALLKKYYPE